jgi:hypothetical protein
MTTDIFIRTYSNDLGWLAYALASIQKYVTGHRNIVITIPKGQEHHLAHLTAETVIAVDDMDDGYLGQQLTKMEAWRYTDADCVLFWDSDVIATEPIDIRQEYFKDGKPILYKTKYSSLPGVPWQGMTEQAVGFDVDWEYMRRMPMIHLRIALAACQAYVEGLHKCDLRTYLEQQPQRAFSEFNALGAYVAKYREKQYAILDTESIAMPSNRVTQFHSWSGITAEARAAINKALA